MALDEVPAEDALIRYEEIISGKNQLVFAVREMPMTAGGRASSYTFFARPENEVRRVFLNQSGRARSEYEWETGVGFIHGHAADVHSSDDIFGLHEEKLSGYFITEGAEADTFLSTDICGASIHRPDLFASFWFNEYTGEWM
ncbi:hypothetical protein [Methanogenium organophilum]|uniref:Uncharacterized protein n=1 Tax=Methanogenium organophilum TaxID=2199 RepID=A0A9X9T7H9_METOG|nr:hypothetical protein [Methanogenium organophilum]WAI00416.1 hypothetical protein OU421_08225 [Methanogenium organophilum]